MGKQLFDADEFSNPSDGLESESSKPRFNKMILVGAPDWVSGMIARLHSAEIAHVRDWSRLVPTQNPGEVISILQRLRRSGD